jgi:quercetin dioxygenase-like cupin family protein
MRHPLRTLALILPVSALVAGIAWTYATRSVATAVSATGTISTKIFEGTHTVAGQRVGFSPYANQFTATVTELPPGGQTGRHRQLIASFAYVLDGTVTVSVEDHGTRTFKAGQSFAAPINMWQNVSNHGPLLARYMVVYAHQQAQQLQQRPQDATDDSQPFHVEEWLHPK